MTEGEPGGATSIAIAESVTALVSGDVDAARANALAAVEAAGAPLLPNLHAAAIWFAGSVFAPGTVGGSDMLDEARETLERNGWRQALREPQLVAAYV
jgi:hypothetical protein